MALMGNDSSTRKKWTDDDVRKLLILNEQGLRKRDMVFYLLRTENAIRAKLWRIERNRKRLESLFDLEVVSNDSSN